MPVCRPGRQRNVLGGSGNVSRLDLCSNHANEMSDRSGHERPWRNGRLQPRRPGKYFRARAARMEESLTGMWDIPEDRPTSIRVATAHWRMAHWRMAARPLSAMLFMERRLPGRLFPKKRAPRPKPACPCDAVCDVMPHAYGCDSSAVHVLLLRSTSGRIRSGSISTRVTVAPASTAIVCTSPVTNA